MPWLYFTIRDGKIFPLIESAESIQILERERFRNHFLEFYDGIKLESPFIHNDITDMSIANNFYMLPKFRGEIPTHFKMLQSVLCHCGSLDAGHYYTLLLTTNIIDDSPNRLKMLLVDDHIITEVDSPATFLL